MSNDPECERPTTSYKLARIDVESSTSPFKILNHKRMPGWHTDAYKTNITNVEEGGGAGIGKRRDLFPEEMIGVKADGITPIPFDVSFEEDGWLGCLRKIICAILAPLFGACQPNKWLGGSMPDDNSNFSRLIHDLAFRVRNYNSTLYLLRQYHYGHDLPHQTLSKENPHGPRDRDGTLLPHPITSEIVNNYAHKVECKFLIASKKLNRLLENENKDVNNKYHMEMVGVDMIEVNGYIVSMRVVANPIVSSSARSRGSARPKEISGSSSHVSITSEFSSYDDNSA